MKVSDTMTREVMLIKPDQSISEAAKRMAECGSGALPVGEDDRLIGVITDRDIAIRAVAHSLPPETPVRQVMSREVLYCYEDEEVEAVAQNMGNLQVRRLPVVNRAKRLVGIVSIGDVAKKTAPRTTGDALAAISRTGGAHDQTVH